MYTNYNQYVDPNSAAIYQQQTSQLHSAGYSMPTTGPSTYGPGPTRSTPTFMAHAPPLRGSGASRRRSPDDLLGPDAPTQPRNYSTPSTTSRKDIPSYYMKRRSPPHLSEEEDDELTEEPPAENATDQEKIDYKRRQNTLAARRSRKRKLVYTQQLEAQVERLTMEKEMWRTRALTLRQLLRSHNLPCPDFKD